MTLSERKKGQTDLIGSSLQYIDALCNQGHYKIAHAVVSLLSASEHPQSSTLSWLASARIYALTEPHRAHEVLSEERLGDLSGKMLGDAHLIRGYAFLELGDPITMLKEMLEAKKHGATLEFPQVEINSNSVSDKPKDHEQLN